MRMQLMLRLSVVRAAVVMAKVCMLTTGGGGGVKKRERREGNKEERDTRNVFSFPYKIRLEL